MSLLTSKKSLPLKTFTAFEPQANQLGYFQIIYSSRKGRQKKRPKPDDALDPMRGDEAQCEALDDAQAVLGGRPR